MKNFSFRTLELTAKSYLNLNIVSGGTPKGAQLASSSGSSSHPFHSNMWSAILQAGSNSVGVEKLTDDSKTEFVSSVFGEVGELIDGKSGLYL